MDASELAVGKKYAFIYVREFHNDIVEHWVMGGMFTDSVATARRHGYDLHLKDARLEMLSPGAAVDEHIVTIHMDGWYGRGFTCTPCTHPATIMYWNKDGISTGYDMLSTYLGRNDDNWPGNHTIVVSSQGWNDDPRLHSTDWNNPDGVVEMASGGASVDGAVAESAIDFDRRTKAKYDAALARALGF